MRLSPARSGEHRGAMIATCLVCYEGTPFHFSFTETLLFTCSFSSSSFSFRFDSPDLISPIKNFSSLFQSHF